jgi:hypothetical protein
MVSGAMRRNVSVAFSHFLLGRSPRIVVGCGFFFLEAGGFQFSVFQNCHLQVFFYSFFFAQSSLSSVAEAPGYFSVSSTRSPGCFSAADVSGKGMFFMVFSPKAFPQEVEMDIHSFLACSGGVFLVGTVQWMPAVQIHDRRCRFRPRFAGRL